MCVIIIYYAPLEWVNTKKSDSDANEPPQNCNPRGTGGTQVPTVRGIILFYDIVVINIIRTHRDVGLRLFRVRLRFRVRIFRGHCFPPEFRRKDFSLKKLRLTRKPSMIDV